MKRFLLFCLGALMCVEGVWAAPQTIRGKVLNADSGEPVVGAAIAVEGTSKGTISDYDGQFIIDVEPGAILRISFIGMRAEEVAAKDGMVVQLSEDSEVLDDVVVVAFGTTTKKSFTGSASVVKADELTKRQTSNITSALAGQVAGVQGFSTSGQPGVTSSVRIRGIGSLNSSNAPLYVIDGVPATTEAIATLSNSDIESVTVSKDAAANALYGARGANGVIIITTKRGSTRDAQVTVDAKWGVNSRAIPTYDVITDPAMYYETFYQALYNQYGDHDKANQYLLDEKNGGLGYQVYTIPEGERLVGINGKLNPHATLGYVDDNGYYIQPDDWYKELFKSNNLRQEYNINLSGSTDKITYYTSASYLDDTGLIENSNYRRVTTRLNVDYQAKKWLKIGTNMSYSHSDQKYPEEDEYGAYSSGNLFYISNNIAPIYPLYIRDAEGNVMIDSNGFTMYDYGDATILNETRAFMNQSNPASAIQLNKSLYKKDLFTGKYFVQIEPLKGLKATANVGIHYNGIRYQATQNPFYGQFASSGGSASVTAYRRMAIDQQYLISYNNTFNDVHHVDALVGYENYLYQSSNVWGSQQYLNNPLIAEVGNAILSPHTSSSTSKYATQGIIVSAKYDYDSKYFGSVSYRRDASSRFAPGRKWGNFWSVGAAWDINEESFMEDVTVVDLLKVKVSYGSQGNDDLLTQDGYTNYYVWADQYAISENNGQIATTLSYKGNEELTWETSYNFNAGVDFELFKGRLTGTIEGWRRRTVDQLYYKPVAPSLGYSFLPMNVGSISNAGLDIELRGDVYKSRNITVSLYANMAYFKNKILSLHEDLGDQWIEGSAIYKVGGSLYNRYIRQFAGVDPETGDAMYYKQEVDENGNETGGKITTTDWSDASNYETGDLLPKIFGGFGAELKAYGVDFSIAFNYQAGGRLYDNAYASLMHTGYSNAGQNWHTDILKAWTPENTNTDVPRLNAGSQSNARMSDRFLVSSNYVSLQNITLGYTLPAKWTKKAHIEKVRVYGVADNVAVWAARKGLDPRQGYASSNSLYYAPMRTISGGVSVTF